MKYNFENKSFENIFEYGLKLAQEKSKYCKTFFKSYIEYIIQKNPDLSKEDAIIRAKDNFGYYAGYYSIETRKLIADTYKAFHPDFGDRYDLSSHEVFMMGYNKANGTYVKTFYNNTEL